MKEGGGVEINGRRVVVHNIQQNLCLSQKRAPSEHRPLGSTRGPSRVNDAGNVPIFAGTEDRWHRWQAARRRRLAELVEILYLQRARDLAFGRDCVRSIGVRRIKQQSGSFDM